MATRAKQSVIKISNYDEASEWPFDIVNRWIPIVATIISSSGLINSKQERDHLISLPKIVLGAEKIEIVLVFRQIYLPLIFISGWILKIIYLLNEDRENLWWVLAQKGK